MIRIFEKLKRKKASQESNKNVSYHIDHLSDYSESYMHIKFLKKCVTFAEGAELNICQGKTNVLVGPNGAGKTTIMNFLKAQNKNEYFTVDNVKQQYILSISAEAFRAKKSFLVNTLEELDIIKQNQKSHGEAWKHEIKRRIVDKCSDNTMIIMDEPETALSIESQIELCQIINDLKSKYRNLGFLIASHSLTLIEFIADEVIEIPECKITSAEEYCRKKRVLLENTKL